MCCRRAQRSWLGPGPVVPSVCVYCAFWSSCRWTTWSCQLGSWQRNRAAVFLVARKKPEQGQGAVAGQQTGRVLVPAQRALMVPVKMFTVENRRAELPGGGCAALP